MGVVITPTKADTQTQQQYHIEQAINSKYQTIQIVQNKQKRSIKFVQFAILT